LWLEARSTAKSDAAGDVPERCDGISGRVAGAGSAASRALQCGCGLACVVGYPFQRRSQWDGSKPIAGGVFLLDTIGELASLYEFADLTFIGGSLVPRGGHNVLEAAQFGKAILVGPHTENFRDIIDIFRRADALRVVTPQSLTPTVLQLLENHDERTALGQRALEVMRSQQGATERTVNALLGLLQEHAPAAAVSSEKRA
jgi:3-deoxy-D-manno-octulosonic-acid transferase